MKGEGRKEPTDVIHQPNAAYGVAIALTTQPAAAAIYEEILDDDDDYI